MKKTGLVALGLLASVSAAPDAAGQTLGWREVQFLTSGRDDHPLAASDGRVAFLGHFDAQAASIPPEAVALGNGLLGLRLRPSELGAWAARHPDIALIHSAPLHPLLDVATVRSNVVAYRNDTGVSGKNVVVGVVDTGVDVTHPDLMDSSGHSRVLWMLDLSLQPMGLHPDLEAKYGCIAGSSACAVLSGADIDNLIANNNTGALPTDMIGHGTHVTSIAAGNGRGSTPPIYTGAAPDASIIAVRATRDDGGDMADSDILLGVQFVFDQAAALVPPLPAVVNLSVGTDYGPHDGTDQLEQSFVSLVGSAFPGRAMVVAAGNSASLYAVGSEVRGIHTETRVVEGSTAQVPIRMPSSPNSTLSGSAYVWISWPQGQELSAGLQGPNGSGWISPVSSGQTGSYKSQDQSVSATVINNIASDDTGITTQSPAAIVVITGAIASSSTFSITLQGTATAGLWVQGAGDLEPSSSSMGVMFAKGVKHGTVDIPATHPSIISAGALLNRIQWTDADGDAVVLSSFGSQRPPIGDSVAYFSGAGPNALGYPKPDICAPGAMVIAAMSRSARPGVNPTSMFATTPTQCPTGTNNCLVVDENHGVASGTSMASPMVAGSLALLLGLDGTLTQPQLQALLQAGARWPDGTVSYPYQVGTGGLDAEGMLMAYELGLKPAPSVPDGGRSWLVIDAAYARPDGASPIWGTLETRTADGGLADGFDSTQLALDLQNASIQQAPKRVAPGLWTFSLVAPDGTGGETMQVAVRFGATQLGASQTIPIGPGLFAATGPLLAQGGCYVSRAAEQTEPGGWTKYACVLGIAGFVRRRRRTRH